MKRDIITIDEDKCTGCGKCIPGCPEGALQIIDGKARLVSDLFCDGLGACINECPHGAMSVENREAEVYDEKKVMINVVKQGENTIKAHLKHLKDHNQTEYFNQAVEFLKENNMSVPELSNKDNLPCGCPGNLTKKIEREIRCAENINQKSNLENWPIQLALLNPNAPYLKNAELLISADCAPFAYGNFHSKFLQNKVLIMFCPKLDSSIEQYIDKLSDIFKNQHIKSITLVRMEVPCCGGVEKIVTRALEQSGKNIIIKEYVISISGEIT